MLVSGSGRGRWDGRRGRLDLAFADLVRDDRPLGRLEQLNADGRGMVGSRRCGRCCPRRQIRWADYDGRHPPHRRNGGRTCDSCRLVVLANCHDRVVVRRCEARVWQQHDRAWERAEDLWVLRLPDLEAHPDEVLVVVVIIAAAIVIASSVYTCVEVDRPGHGATETQRIGHGGFMPYNSIATRKVLAPPRFAISPTLAMLGIHSFG